MGRGEDRISNLPNEVLQSILCLLPLKYAIRTSILSKRWIHLWKFNLISSTSLQFGEDFSCNQSPKQFAATLDRYLQLHGDRNLDKFGILFSPFEYFFPDLENWVRVVLAKGVKELDIDLSQGVFNSTGIEMDNRMPIEIPSALFYGNSLTHLSLSRCEIVDSLHDSSNFFVDTFHDMSVFFGLNSLSLDCVYLIDEMLLHIAENCVSLESISLKRCHQLEVVDQFQGDNLKLKKFVIVDCLGMNDMRMSVPKLQSFVYHGSVSVSHVFNNVSHVTDAYICLGGLDDSDEEIVYLLSKFSHVKVLTICSFILKSVFVIEEHNNEGDLPIELGNLQELQLVLDSISKEHICCVFSFFVSCPAPFLEKLFIQLLSNLHDQCELSDLVTTDKDTPDVVFQNLKWIKIANFEGSPLELKLVKLLLEKAIILEWIFLIMDQHDELNDSLSRRILQGQLSILPKASKDAQIVICGSSDHDCMLNPTHTTYHQEKYRKGTTVHLENETIRDRIIVLDQEFL